MNKENATSFIYMGDPQCSRLRGKPNDYSQWGQLLRRALLADGDGSSPAAEGKQLLILGGDIVNRAEGLEAWETFFEQEYNAAKAAGAEISDLELATVPTGSAESTGVYAGRFLNPGNGPAGHEKEFFSFDYGCCHFLFLSSEYMGNRSPDAVRFIADWIRDDLSSCSRPVVFAVMHHPVYTLGTSFDDDVRAAAMRENYLPLFAECGVDFILCGHQHVYCRTKNTDITQIMGVSGTKYFDAYSKSSMAVVREYASTATLFETDGEIIRLKTIDVDGNVLDAFAQQVRQPDVSGRHDTAIREGGSKPAGGDPLRPVNKEGISVSLIGDSSSEMLFTDAQLSDLEKIEIEYSVLRKGVLRYETVRGFRLSELIGQVNEATCTANSVLMVTDSRGRQKALVLREVMNARRFSVNEAESGSRVPALITREGESYRLIYGQQTPEHYNGRGWMRDIRRIELRGVAATTFDAV